MKCLILTPGVFDKGGIARYGRFQIKALREAFGDEAVRVLSLAGRQPDDIEEPFEVDWAGPVPLSKISRVYFSAVALSEILNDRPEVILTQHLHMGPLAWTLARLCGSRLVQNIYGHEIWSGVTAARRAALQHSDLIIADAHNSADRARDLGLVRGPTAVVWDCVDLERYTPGEPDEQALERYGLSRKTRFRLLFLGRLHPHTRYKGSERMIRLVAGLPAQRFEAVLAGRGEDVESLRALASELGAADRVFLTGGIHEADMPNLYRSADVFYLVSEAGPRQGEGIPVTPIEAMACGAPIIVGNQDGSRELLDGAGGVCGDPTDVGYQTSYLIRLAKSEDLHRAERAVARQRAVSAFGYDAFAAKTVEALHRLTNRTGRIERTDRG